MRLADHRRTLGGLARFLFKYGYWPASRELTMLIRCDHLGLICYLKELAEGGLCEQVHPPGSGAAYYQLTLLGWKALGIAPIEPWVRRRGRKFLQRVAYKVMIDLADIERAERKAAEAQKKLEALVPWEAENGEATEDADG